MRNTISTKSPTIEASALQESYRQNPLSNPILIIGALFFVFGFITWLNAVLIPYLRIACELTNFESYFVAFAFYIAYLVMALPSGWLLKILGFKKGMVAGLIIIACGAAIFIPAASVRSYMIFLFGLFVQGTGLALLQTASNPYVTILGPLESAAKRISIMGVCNKTAGAIAPLILGAVTLKDADSLTLNLQQMNPFEKGLQLDVLAARVIWPYTIMVIALLLLSVLIYRSALPDVDTDEKEDTLTESNTTKKSVLQFPHLLLGVLTVFLYIGVEVIAGDTIIAYGLSEQIPFSIARFFTTYTLISMIVGYLIGIVCIPKYLSQERALQYCGLLGMGFSLVIVLTEGYVSVLFLALLGLANSLVWPALWPLALNGLGKFSKSASSLLVMGLAGGAVIPLLFGQLVDIFSPRVAYLILLPSYLVIYYFASSGHRIQTFGKSKLKKL